MRVCGQEHLEDFVDGAFPIISAQDLDTIKALCASYLNFWQPWVKRCPALRPRIQVAQQIARDVPEDLQQDDYVVLSESERHTLFELLTVFKCLLATIPRSALREVVPLDVERLSALLVEPSPYQFITAPMSSMDFTRDDFRCLETILTCFLEKLQWQHETSEGDDGEKVQEMLKAVRKRLKNHLYLEEDFEHAEITLTLAEVVAIQAAIDEFVLAVEEQFSSSAERDLSLSEMDTFRQRFADIHALLSAQQETP